MRAVQTLRVGEQCGPPAFAPVTWFAVLVSVFSLSVCKSNLGNLDFLHGVVGPVEDRELSKDERLYVPTSSVSFGKVAPAVWVATERPEKAKQFVSLPRAPFAQEFENLPPQIDLILHRI
jgi:hypothetical protein